MDVLKAVQTYVMKMITEVPGMKVLLLDAHTVSSTLILRCALAGHGDLHLICERDVVAYNNRRP